MAVRLKGGATPIALGLQIAELSRWFPEFRFERAATSWYGHLQPAEDAARYRVKLTYRPPNSPKVWVKDPKLHSDAPHRYPDRSLCLYDPRRGEWHPSLFLAETIVPWTAEWLLYYEAWLIDPERRWFGPEAPHGRLKRPAR